MEQDRLERPSSMGAALRSLRLASGLTHEALAQRMVQAGLLLDGQHGCPKDTQGRVSWLADALRSLEGLSLQDADHETWPLVCTEVEFTEYVQRAAQRPDAQQTLLLALMDDELARYNLSARLSRLTDTSIHP